MDLLRSPCPARWSAVALAAALALAGCTAEPDPRSAGTQPPSQTPSPSSSPSSSATASTPTAPPEAYTPGPFEPAAFHDWRTSIPAGLRVDLALPRSEDEPATVGVRSSFCGHVAFRRGGEVDRRTASVSGPEYGEARDLRVFPDDRAAHAFVASVADVVSRCHEQVVGGTTWRHELRRSGLRGDESFTAVQTFETGAVTNAGANWWEVVRVGNAVLLTATGGEWMPGSALDGGIRDHVRDVRPIVRAMCVFAASGCPPRPLHDIPAGFPLAAGLPDDDAAEPVHDYGLHGPRRGLAPPLLDACGARLADAAHVDRLGVRWTNVEDFRGRTLTTYADAYAASRSVAAIEELYRACPRDDGDDGDPYTTLIDVLPSRLGGQSWVVVRRFEYDGHPAVGLEVLHVVRLGRAVLLDTTSNEGGSSSDPAAEARRQAREQAIAFAEVLAAMCVFTEAGCP